MSPGRDDPELRRRRRLTDWAVVALVVATFGPYTMIPGVRTEQLAVYALLLAAVPVYLRLAPRPPGTAWYRPRLPGTVWLIAALILVQTAVAALASRHPVEISRVAGRSPVAALDNLLLPLAALTVGAVAATLAPDAVRLLRVALRTLVIAVCVNALLAFAQLAFPLGWLAWFWTAERDGRSVAELAAQMGRYTGVFNQPAEAGMVYGMALLAAIYLYRERTLRLTGSFLVLTAGGLLTVSKIFLLIALPVALCQLAIWGGTRGRLLVGGGTLAALLVVTQQSVVPIGGASLDPLLHPAESGGGLIDLYTAGRFGPNSTLKGVIDLVLRHSPWIGFGFVGLNVPYDNGLVEAVVAAGVIGGAVYFAVLVTLCVAWWRRRGPAHRAGDTAHRTGNPGHPALSRLHGGLLLIVIGGSFGLPTLTANRAATIAWLLIGFFLVAMPTTRRAPRSSDPTASDPIASDPIASDPTASDLTASGFAGPVEVTVEVATADIPAPAGGGVPSA